MKYKIFFSGVLLFFQNFLLAHNPAQSSMQLSIYEQSGILEVNLAQYGVEQALLKKYPDLDLKSIEPKTYKELIINYLKENIDIRVDGEQLIIGKGAIKLGNHQTDLKFQIENIPNDPQHVDVDAPCFQENEKQQNFFRIVYQRMTVRKKLTQENNFTSRFTITESGILVNGKKESSISNYIYFGGAAIFLFSIGLFLKVRMRNSSKGFQSITT